MSIHVLSWVLRHSEARLADRLVLIVLADKADDDGAKSYPAVQTIADQARVSRRAAQSALRSLEGAGRIARVGSSEYGTTEYRVLMGGADPSPPGAQNTTQPTSDSSPNPSFNRPTGGVEDAKASSPPPDAVRGRIVNRRKVTKHEADLAEGIMVHFNAKAGTDYSLGGPGENRARTCIIMRIRERPQMALPEHQEVIDAAFHHPWWDDVPTPAVIYGNRTLFERMMLKGRRTSDTGWNTADLYERTKRRRGGEHA